MNKKIEMDLQQLQAEHLRKYMEMKIQRELFLNRTLEEKEDITLTRNIIEQARLSSLSLNHIQTSQSVQPNQQSPFDFSLFIQHSVAETNANATERCFPMENDLHSKVEALITPLLNSTPNQIAPIVETFIPHNPYHSKDWYQSFPQDLRRHFIQRLVKEMVPDLDLFQFKRMHYLVRHSASYEGRMYETANSKEEYYQLYADKIFDLQKTREANKRKEIEERKKLESTWGLEGPESDIIIPPYPQLVTPTTEDFAKRRGHLKMLMLLRQETLLLHHLKQTFHKELELHQLKNSSSLSEEQIKVQVSKEKLENQLEGLSNKLTQMKKTLADSSLSIIRQNLHLQMKQLPSEVADSIRNSDRIEERRHHVREEVLANRRNNQLKAANLNRGLVMDVDDQGASKSDRTFDLTTLDKALPSVSNSKRAPRMTRALKLQEIVMNNMKETRLCRLALGLSLTDSKTAE